MSKIKVHSEVLNDFVDTYFVKMDFSKLEAIKDEDLVSLLSNIEKTIVDINMKNYSDDDPILWYNREICLRSLVVMTQLSYFADILAKHSLMERGLMLLARVVESFNKKVMEDPEIVKAIEENRLEAEMEKHFPSNVLISKRNSNFIELIDDAALNSVPDEFEIIPEKF